MGVIHDARARGHAIAAKLSEVASFTRIVQRMAHVTAARVTMHGTAKACGHKISDGAEELAGVSSIHGDWTSSAVHSDQRKAGMLIVATVVSVTWSSKVMITMMVAPSMCIGGHRSGRNNAKRKPNC
jgi:hypothetical protein